MKKSYKIPIIIILVIILGMIGYAFFLFLADKQTTPTKADESGQALIEQGVDKQLRARKERDAADKRADSLQKLLDKKPTKEIVYRDANKKINIVDAYNEFKLDSILTNYRFIGLPEKADSQRVNSRRSL